MGRPGEGVVVCHQHFPSPDGRVGPQPSAIEGEADHRPDGLIFGHAGGNVGMVVLNLDTGDAHQLPGITGAHIVRVQVAGHDLWIDVQNAFEMVHREAEEVLCGPVFQVTDMLAHKGLPAPGEADRVLQLSPAGQHRRHVIL